MCTHEEAISGMTELSAALSEKPSDVEGKLRAFPPGARAHELSRNMDRPPRVPGFSGIFVQARQEANR